MEFEFHEHGAVLVAEVIDEGVVVSDVQDALDLMANARYQGADRIIVHQRHLAAAFFELRSRLAGDILQKAANYQVELAIVGEFDAVESESLRAFIVESNRGRQVGFVADVEAATARLLRGT